MCVFSFVGVLKFKAFTGVSVTGNAEWLSKNENGSEEVVFTEKI